MRLILCKLCWLLKFVRYKFYHPLHIYTNVTINAWIKIAYYNIPLEKRNSHNFFHGHTNVALWYSVGKLIFRVY